MSKQTIQLIAYRRETASSNIYKPKPYYLDTQDNTAMSINYNFEDISNPESRKTDYSQTFKLPFSNTNNDFFEHWYNVNINNLVYTQNEAIESQVLVNGVPVLTGNLRLMGVYVKGGYYEVTVLGKVSTLFSAVGNKKLRQAFQTQSTTDATVYNSDTDLLHTWTSNVIEASWNGTLQNDSGDSMLDSVGGVSKVLYPLQSIAENQLYFDSDNDAFSLNNTADPSDATAGDRVFLDRLSPAIQLRTVLQKVISKAGFSFTSTFLDSVYFRRLYMTTMDWQVTGTQVPMQVANVIYNGDAYQIAPTSAQISTPPLLLPESGEFLFSNTVGSVELAQSSFSGPAIDAGSLQVGANTFFTPPNNGLYQVSIATHIDHVNPADGDSNVTIYFGMRFFGSAFVFPVAQQEIFLNGQNSELISLSTQVGLAQGQDYIPFMAIVVNNGFSTPVISLGQTTKINTNQFYNIQVLPQSLGETVAGGVVDVGRGINDKLSQAQFLKDIIQRFNLLVVTDKNDPTNLIIEPFSDYIGTGESLFWEDKIDKEKEMIVKPTSALQKKNINLGDKESEDYYNKLVKTELPAENVFGKYEEENDNVFAQGELKNTPVFAPFIVDRVRRSFNSTSVDPFMNNVVIHTRASYNDSGALVNKEQPHKLFYYNGTPTNIGATINFMLINVSSNFQEVTANVLQYTTYPLCTAYELDNNGFLTNPITNTRLLYWKYNRQFEWLSSSTLWQGYNGDLPNGLYKKYWEQYVKELYSDDSRILELYLYLTPTDIANFSYKDLIYLKQTYWRVVKIENYEINSTASTKAVLLKVPNLEGTPCLTSECDAVEANASQLVGSALTNNVYYFTSSGGTVTPVTTEACCDCVGGNFLPYTLGTGAGLCFEIPEETGDSAGSVNDGNNSIVGAQMPFAGSNSNNRSLHTTGLQDVITKKFGTVGDFFKGIVNYTVGSGSTSSIVVNPNPLYSQISTFQISATSVNGTHEIFMYNRKNPINFTNDTINDVKIRLSGFVSGGAVDTNKSICFEVNTAFRLTSGSITQIGATGGEITTVYNNTSTLTVTPIITYGLVSPETRARLISQIRVLNGDSSTKLLWTGEMTVTSTSISNYVGSATSNNAVYQNGINIAFQNGEVLQFN